MLSEDVSSRGCAKDNDLPPYKIRYVYNNRWNPVVSVGAARAHRDVSASLAEYFSVPQESLATLFTPERAASTIGNITALATNLLFSVELYVKSLVVFEGKEFKSSHNLTQTYQTIIAPTRAEISKIYSLKQSQLSQINVISIFAGDTTNKPDDISSKTPESLIKGIEKEYTRWRYRFDRGKIKPPNDLPFAALLNLCNAIDDLISRSITFKARL